MKKILLTQEQTALVDDEDFEWLNQWRWYAAWDSYTEGFYAVRVDRSSGSKVTIRMARLIMNCPSGKQVDHKNHITLDNQRHNLRICTRSQNKQNSKRYKKSSSIYKGVRWRKDCNKWQARIQVEEIFNQSCSLHLGCFETEKGAAFAYNKAAIKYFGEFACLNNIESIGQG